MRGRITGILIAFSLAAVLAACGSATQDAAEPPSPPETASADAASASERKVSFETIDLDGNPVRSEDLFRQNRLTMVNLWGTYCGPCINEMPDLEVLNGRLEGKGCGIVGVVCDVVDPGDDTTMGAAEKIISETGVTYRNLIPWNGFNRDFPAQFIPTTFFVDSDGTIVGETVVGARGADDYETLIDAALKTIQ